MWRRNRFLDNRLRQSVEGVCDMMSISFGLCVTHPGHIRIAILSVGLHLPFWGVLCPDSHLAGLDIVPLHPDLQQIGSPDLASRITWVQDNL